MPEQIVLDTAASVVDERSDAETLGSVPEERPQDELVLNELLVEDVSIDGMCGVY